MKHIKLDDLPRIVPQAIIDSLTEAKREIEAKVTDKERHDYIDHNGDRWTALTPFLWQLGNLKCWYSEDSLQVGEAEVEHYRPKKSIAGIEHTGYWWRAFDWKNYRLSHRTCNVRRTDYLTKKKVGKGTYFPLVNEANRAIDEAGILNEEPILLDPINPNDVKLLCFDLQNGRPKPSPFCKGNDLNIQRVQETIEYFHLDEGTWNVRRKDVIDSVQILCDKLIKTKLQNNEDDFDIAFADLKNNYLHDNAVFLSTAYQVVKEAGLLEVVL